MTQATEQHSSADLPDRQPGRAAIIAAIHAYAQWLADNPDVPAPDRFEGVCFQYDVEPHVSVQVASMFADAHGARKHSESGSRWATLRLFPDGPIEVKHTVFTNSERRKSEEW